MTITHEASRQQLVDYVTGHGDHEQRLRFEAHLAGCQSCTAAVNAWQAIAAADQATQVPALGPSELDRLRARRPQRSRIHIVHKPSGSHLITGQRSRRATRTRVLLGTAAGLVLIAVGALLVLPGGAGGPDSAAATTLKNTATVAAARSTLVLEPGQYWYFKTIFQMIGSTQPVVVKAPYPSYQAVQNITTQTWLSPKLPLEGIVRLHADPTVATPGGRAAWVAAGRPVLFHEPEINLGPGSLNDWQLMLRGPADYQGFADELAAINAIPTGDRSLKTWLKKQVADDAPGQSAIQWCPNGDPSNSIYGCDTTIKIFGAATALLAAPIASPALRAALFRVIGTLPGLALQGSRSDRLGRHGTSVAITYGAIRYELIFDPSTATLLADDLVLLKANSPTDPDPAYPGTPAGTTVQSTTFVASGISQGIGKTP